MSKGIFWISKFFHLDTDNLTARDPLTWRWMKETSVIPYASELDTAAQPQAGQHVGPAQSLGRWNAGTQRTQTHHK